MSREYRVLSSSGTDNEFDVLFAPGLPQFGYAHPSYPDATVKSRTARQESEDSKKAWIVTVNWDTQSEEDEQQDPQENTNPLSEKWSLRIVTSTREEMMVKDLAGDPIESSAGEPIRNIFREVSDFSFVLSGNMAVSAVDFDAIKETMNQANQTTFFTVPAGEAKLMRFEAEYLYHRVPGRYWATQWEFAVRDGGWDIEVLDEGFFELDSSGDKVQIMVKTADADGTEGEPQPVSEPYPLDGSGHRLADGDPHEYLTFKRVSQKPFSALNIPTATTDSRF